MSVFHHVTGVFRARDPLLQSRVRKPLFTPPNQFFAVIIGGVDRTTQVHPKTTKLRFVLAGLSKKATLSVYGFDPSAGQSIIIQSGTRRFAGTIQRVIQKSVRANAYKEYDLECIGWSWLLNRRRVTKTWPAGTNASTIILDIFNLFTSGFTTAHVQAGAPTISAPLQARGQLVTVLLQTVADLVNWRIDVDVDRDGHFYATSSASPSSTAYGTAQAGTAFVVPAGVGQLTVKAWGAAGGADGGDGAKAGGGGGYAQATIPTTPGESLLVYVGGGGARNANSWQGGGGGGYSGVFRGATPLVIAGAGAGAARDGGGGPGGGTTGITGSGFVPGSGGTPAGGGVSGANADGADVGPAAGASLAAGAGGGWTVGSGAGSAGGLNGGGAGGPKGSGTAATFEYLIVGGGGSGGHSGGGLGGGGGAGDFRAGSMPLAIAAYPVTVGPGGTASGGQGNDGSSSSALGITAIGGGGGSGVVDAAGDNGASGGGGHGPGGGGGSATGVVGNAGGSGNVNAGGGGGGSGAVGGNAGSGAGANGGAGTASSISGGSVNYAGGGGGNGNVSGGSGQAGGGNGGAGGSPATSAAANTGSGGGAGDTGGGSSGVGGSGIVIVRYLTGTAIANGGTITTSGGYTIHTFTTSGTFTVTANVGRTGGGGGAGYFGGGGGGADGLSGKTSGGGGGASYVSGGSSLTTPGSGATPGNTSDTDYAGNAGLGSASAAGNPGRVVLTYTPAPEPSGQPPQPLTAANYTYDELEYTLDLSQVRTRASGAGGGGSTTAPVAVGATSIPVDECSWYSSSGGTTVAHGQLITYTGRSATSGPGNLTGVQASGAGSIGTALLQGDVCNIYLQVDDATAQTALAALEGGDGIHEDWIEDSTWDSGTLTAKLNASLAAFKNTDVRGKYTSWDDQTAVGQTVPITLSLRNISVNVTLQEVNATHKAPNRWFYEASFAVVWSDLIDLITAVVKASAKP